MSEVSIADVRRVAELANLELTAGEESQMQRDLSSILKYVNQLAEIDTSEVEPMSQVGDALGGVSSSRGERLRTDVVQPSIDRGAVMAAAPETDGRFFKVPKVIER